MARKLAPGEKPLDWIGSSKKDFLALPESVRTELGTALGVTQFGGRHPSAKPWKGEGPGVMELVEHFDGDTYRTVYTVRFERVVYVLHAFQKKSPRGVRTAKPDVELIRQRLRVAHADYMDRYSRKD